MSDKRLPPPPNSVYEGDAAQRAKPDTVLAQTVAFDPSSETGAGSDQTLNNYTPPDETHPRAGDPTFLAPSPSDQTLAPHMMATVEMLPGQAGSDQTLGGGGPATVGAGPDATMGGGMDAATQAFHKQAMASAPKAITKGASFGHYELLEPIAKGGMGIVYKARQRNLNRIVAIKMILAGQFADQSDIDRFYAEAEAAAALSHPNIVAIHEIGEVSGQHFFSMDYIEGQSLSGLVQENPIPPRRAAEFVRTIAETMQFAHESGVVHRDLKPANVLLDKRQRPLITDFGLAKQVSNTSQLTMAGSIVGTPSYMPPEQAAGKIEDVGPWSDLYSIGAILYELLTGRPPFRAASPFETIRQVLEQEPPSPRLLNPALPRDLETIALKCLQKERTRRYESAQELADELGRFLRGEPIHARPISKAARFWRLCKRYPLTSSAIALAIVILITSTIVSTGFYIQASRALVKETEAKALAEQRKAQADASFRDAMDAVDQFLTRVGESKLANLPGGQTIQKELLDDALVYSERFLQQRGDDPSVANELARSHFRVGKISMTLGRYDDARTPLLAAKQKQTELLANDPNDEKKLKALSDTLTELGQVSILTKKFKDAQRDYAEAIEIRSRLARLFPANDEYQRLWANGYMNAGLIAVNHAVAVTDRSEEFGPWIDKARADYLESQKIRIAWLDHDPKHPLLRRDLAKGFTNLGNLEDHIGRYDEATGYMEKAAAIYEDLHADNPRDLSIQRDLTTTHRRVADLLLNQKKVEEARQWYQQAFRRLDKLVKENPAVPEYQARKAEVLLNLRGLEKQEGNHEVARNTLEQARKIYRPLVEKHGEVAEYRGNLLTTLQELANDYETSGNRSAAIETVTELLTWLTRFVGEFREERGYALGQGDAYCQLARLSPGLAAFESCRSAAVVFEKLIENDPSDLEALGRLADVRRLYGDLLRKNDQPAEARKYYQQALQTYDALVKGNPDEPAYPFQQSVILLSLYYLENEHVSLEDSSPGAARLFLEQAAAILEKLVAAKPEELDFKLQQATLWIGFIDLELEEGQVEAAQLAFRRVGDIISQLLSDKPGNLSFELQAVTLYVKMCDLKQAQGNSLAAQQAIQKALDLLNKHVKEKPEEVNYQGDRAAIMLKSFEFQIEQEDFTAARMSLDQARTILETLLKDRPDPYYEFQQVGLLLSTYQLEHHEGNAASARAALEKAKKICGPLAKFKKSARNLGVIHRELARQLNAAGEVKAAAQNLNDAVEIFEKLVQRFPNVVEFRVLLRETQALTLTHAAK